MEDAATSAPPSLWASLNSWFTSTVFFVLLNLMIATIVFTSNLPSNNQHHHHHQQQAQEEEQEKQNPHDDRNQPQIARSPSILHRLRSFHFYPQRYQHEFSPAETQHHHQEPLEVAATQYVFNQPLHYQHFDFDPTNSDQLAATANYSSTNQNHGIQTPNSEPPVNTMPTHFDLDPTRQGTDRDTGFEDAHEAEHTTDEFQSLDEVYSKLQGAVHVDRSKSDGELPPKPPTKMKKSASLKVGFSHLEEEEVIEARRPATVREKKAAVRVEEDDDVEVDAKADDFINKFKNDLKLQRIESIIRTKGATGRGTAK